MLADVTSTKLFGIRRFSGGFQVLLSLASNGLIYQSTYVYPAPPWSHLSANEQTAAKSVFHK